jgi:PAS domain S-box-containing protein
MQKSIEMVSNLQVEFWTHLTTLVPDLNVLNELGKKIYVAAEDVDKLWSQLCMINPNYQGALTLYGEYLKDIRNHEHIGTALYERGMSNTANKKTLDDHGVSSDILFNEYTTIVHVSGNKESIGKIMNAS